MDDHDKGFSSKKVLFIYPGIAYIGYNSYERSLSGSDSDPIYAFSLLAALVKKRGWEVELLDLRQMKNEEECFQALSQSNAGIAAITVQTPSFNIASRVACLAKGLGKITIGGGIHATVSPEDFVDHPSWDHVITGEAESAFPRLLDEIQEGGQPEKMIFGEVITDLDSLPLPYFFTEWEEKYKLTYSIEIARGCPGKCSYCVSGEKKFYKKIRFRSLEHVLREIDYAYEKFKFKHLLFLDVCASSNKRFFIELLSRLAERYPHLDITTQERVDSFNDEVASLLSRFNSCMVWFGFESASQKVLNFINKTSSVEKGLESAELCRKYGLEIGANILIGIPIETNQDIQLTYDFVKRINPTMLFCNILSPFPGTEIHKYCKENNVFPEIDSYDRYELRNVLEKGFILNIDYENIRYWHTKFNLLISKQNMPFWKYHLKRVIMENFDMATIKKALEVRPLRFLANRIF